MSKVFCHMCEFGPSRIASTCHECMTIVGLKRDFISKYKKEQEIDRDSCWISPIGGRTPDRRYNP